MAFSSFDPLKVVATWNGINIQGFVTGTFIKAERSEAHSTDVSGAQGDVARIVSRDHRGMVTFTLMADSTTNDLMYAALLEDELGGLNVGPLLVKDLNGNTEIEAAEAWIQKVPDVELSTEFTNRPWILMCAQLNIKPGGNVFGV